MPTSPIWTYGNGSQGMTTISSMVNAVEKQMRYQHEDQPGYVAKVLDAAHRPRLVKDCDREATDALAGLLHSLLWARISPFNLKNGDGPRQSTVKNVKRLLVANADPNIGVDYIRSASTKWIGVRSDRPLIIAADLVDAGAALDRDVAITAIQWLVEDPVGVYEADAEHRRLEANTGPARAPSRRGGRL